MIKTKHLDIIPLDVSFSNDMFQLWGDYEVIKYTYSELLKTPEE